MIAAVFKAIQADRWMHILFTPEWIEDRLFISLMAVRAEILDGRRLTVCACSLCTYCLCLYVNMCVSVS